MPSLPAIPINTTGGIGDVTISASGLTGSGLSLIDNGDGSAQISGTVAAGSAVSSPFSVVVEADDSADQTDTENFSITVEATFPDDDYSTFTLGEDFKGSGSNVLYDGALWIVTGSSQNMARIDDSVSGPTETVGTSAGIVAGVTANTRRNSLCATSDGVYLLTNDGSSARQLFLVTGVDTYTNKATPLHNRSNPITAVGRKVYSIGLTSGTANPFTGVYDPDTNAWSTLTAGPCDQENPRVFTFDGKVHVMWGTLAGGFFHARYDPVTDAWTNLDDPPATVDPKAAAVCVFSTKVYVMGSQISGGDLHVYTPATDSWVQREATGNAPVGGAPAESGVTAVIDGKIYSAGAIGSGSEIVTTLG